MKQHNFDIFDNDLTPFFENNPVSLLMSIGNMYCGLTAT